MVELETIIMEIKFLGHSSFLIKTRKAVLVADPYDPSVGLYFPKTTADIVTISHEHADHNNYKAVKGVRKVINGPGEYELSDVSIIGISTYHDDKKGLDRGKNVIYIIEADGFRIAHLGDLGHKLSDKQLEKIGAIDILMIPVGGEYTIGSELAARIAQSVEALFTIPMHYQTKGLNPKLFSKLSDVDPFLTALGLPVERVSKITPKKGGLDENSKIVIFEK